MDREEILATLDAIVGDARARFGETDPEKANTAEARRTTANLDRLESHVATVKMVVEQLHDDEVAP